MMNRGERVGLEILIVAFLITFLVLSYDLFFLYLRGKETISGHIWEHLQAWQASGYKLLEFPLLTILLPNGVSLQAVGLFVHLISGLFK